MRARVVLLLAEGAAIFLCLSVLAGSARALGGTLIALALLGLIARIWSLRVAVKAGLAFTLLIVLATAYAVYSIIVLYRMTP